MCFLLPPPSLCIALIAAIVLSGCGALSGTRIDNIPMYGQPEIERSKELKRSDEEFIKNASDVLGSRENASKAWGLEGDTFMSQGNFDYAMRRYNQSWLLNPENFQAYWGFGRVLLAWGKPDESLEHFEKANQLLDDQYQKVALLSDIATAYSVKANQTPKSNSVERSKYFSLANQNFVESVRLDPNFSDSYRSWARSLYFEGRYAEAWEKVKMARTLRAPEFPPQFISALEEKMPEP